MKNTREFFQFDYPHTLFPLKTNLLMVQHHWKELETYIYQKVLNPQESAAKFLAQQRVYAPKRHGHLRRTFKLDPVSEYFIYDLVYRNRQYFKKSPKDTRQNFGYRFSKGTPISISSSFRAFRRRVTELQKKHKFSISFDIASCFNTLYHHDLVTWLEDEVSATPKDVAAFGEFLREINSGRSIDCLPQGLYPTKMIGNSFLRSIDQNFSIRSSFLIRFMDDIYLFDSDSRVVEEDFILIQKLLGEKGLNINPNKTHFEKDAHFDVKREVSAIRKKLKKIVEEIEVTQSGIELFSTIVVRHLSNQEVKNLLKLFDSPKLEEEDAEIILALLQKHSEDALSHLPMLLEKFPNLSKSIHRFCALIKNKAKLRDVIEEHLMLDSRLDEFQVFWLGAIVDDFLFGHVPLGGLLPRLWGRAQEAGAKIAMAKILEIPEKKDGMLDLKEQYLKTGQSDWLSWSAAIGVRSVVKSKRNHLLKYFANGSMLNYLISSCALKL